MKYVTVRRASPRYQAVQWEEADEKSSRHGTDYAEILGVQWDPLLKRAFIVTVHRSKIYMRHGMWLVFDEDGSHMRPVSDDEFKRHYEVIE